MALKNINIMTDLKWKVPMGFWEFETESQQSFPHRNSPVISGMFNSVFDNLNVPQPICGKKSCDSFFRLRLVIQELSIPFNWTK